MTYPCWKGQMTSLSEYINTKLLHPTSSGVNNIPSLDGVRGVAILMVITCHLFAHSVETGNGFSYILNIAGSSFDIRNVLMPGANGVRLFFILSAFLLFMPYVRANIHGYRKADTTKFYKRRAMRILPAYLLVLCVFALGAWLVKGAPINRVNLFLNIFFIQPFFYFRNDVGPDFIPGTWSLVTEVHFYILMPFIARLFCSLKKGMLVALFLMVTGHYYRAYVVSHITAPGAKFILGHNILAHIDIFGLGMLAALIYVKCTEEEGIPPWIPYMLLISGALAYWWIFNGGLFFIRDYETLLGMSFFMLVLGVVMGLSPVRHFMEWGPLRIVGLISYSMFLINVLLAKYFLGPLMNMLLIKEPLQRLTFNMTAGIVILFVVSMLSYRYIERPFLANKIRHR